MHTGPDHLPENSETQITVFNLPTENAAIRAIATTSGAYSTSIA
jgi:hypothetical protein